MMRGVDISNLQGPPETYRNQPWYQAAEFVLVQAIEPPAGYPGHDFIDPETGRHGYTGVQLRAAVEDGKKVGVYAWLWNGLADTRGDILRRLGTVPASVKLDIRPWVDVEDTTTLMGIYSASAMNPGLAQQLQCEPRPSA